MGSEKGRIAKKHRRKERAVLFDLQGSGRARTTDHRTCIFIYCAVLLRNHRSCAILNKRSVSSKKQKRGRAALKNLLLTTLGNTKDRMDVEYFHFCKPNGEKTYCTGISVAEAGTKYILANYPVDEIIVLGEPGAGNSTDGTEPIRLIERELPPVGGLSGFSEYGFYCYRILQYLMGLDIEANDINESLSDAQCEDALAKLHGITDHYRGSVRDKELFRTLDNDPECNRLLAALKSSMSKKQLRWLKYNGYLKMDSFYKMRLLHLNRDVTVRFLPVEKNERGVFDTQYLNRIIGTLLSERSFEANCYLDLQGMDFCDGYTFFNIFSMLRHSTNRRIDIAGIIQSTGTVERLSAPILDEWTRLEMHELLTGVNIFLNYGKADYVQNYWRSHDFRSTAVERMLTGMNYVEEGISLCNIPVLTYGISVLRELFRDQPPQQSGELVYAMLASTIQRDYGRMLDGEKVSIPELLGWVLRKKLYQQALTIIESQVPMDMIERGIFYYAQTQEDLDRLLKELNVRYWNEAPKTRYGFQDLSHYFIKIYGRDMVDYRQKKDAVNRDFARLRISQLHGDTELLPAYSDLHNDDLLYELLLNYYNLSRLRNAVCHALPPEKALGGGEELVPASNLEVLDKAIRKFTELYASVCRRIKSGESKSLILEPERFRGYCRRHQLVPFAQPDENTLESACICSYNGQEITVNIRMLRPQESE